MIMDFTILILILPLVSFLILGLCGMKMPHKAAGIIGTASLATVAILSYVTAALYFGAGRTAEGIFATITPYNICWLPLGGTLSIDMQSMPIPLTRIPLYSS